jgi:hypothetical protein
MRYDVRMKPDDLTNLKDDMVAYIAALGLERFSGFVGEDIPSVLWCAPHEVTPVAAHRPEDGWKEFLERAKSTNVSFVVFSEQLLLEEELDSLEEDLTAMREFDAEDESQFRTFRKHLGQIGSLQLGFPCQGIMFLYETTTDWYEDFRLLRDSIEDFGDMILDTPIDDTRDDD